MNNSYVDTENRILGDLLRNPLEGKSLLQLSRETGLSYVTVFKIVPYLEKEKLVRVEKKGKANLVSVDFDNSSVRRLSSSIADEQNKMFKKYPTLSLIRNEFEEQFADSFYILLLFGSYAKEEAKKSSDVDLLLIIPNNEDEESYSERLNKVSRFHNKISCKIVKAEDFSKMLNEKHSVGRAAFSSGVVLFGAEQYYLMVKNYVGQKGY